jgi:thiamine biosynthesis protein ThiC
VAILKAICDEISLSQDQEFEDDMVIEVSAKRDVIMEIINDRKQELCEIEELSNTKINLRIDESATLDTFFIERKKLKKYKISHTALSTIDKTHYIDQEKADLKSIVVSKNKTLKQKINKNKKVDIIDEVPNHKTSLIKRIFTNLLK